MSPAIRARLNKALGIRYNKNDRLFLAHGGNIENEWVEFYKLSPENHVFRHKNGKTYPTV